MYIWTEECHILNLDHYARVTVNKRDGNVYELLAIAAPVSTSGVATVIARFDNVLDAEYANCLLFKALMAHAGAWDTTAVDSLSQKWEFVKNDVNYAEDKHVVDLLTRSEMRVTGLQEVTIFYSSECHQKMKNSLHESQQAVREELDLDVDIKWEPTDDIPW